MSTKNSNTTQPCNIDIVTGSSFIDDPIEGITEGKEYKITYEGKDEVQVINDFGKKTEYSKNCFKNYL